MPVEIYVHPHTTKHGISEDEIAYAWNNFVRSQRRRTPREEQIIRIGYGMALPTPIQMIGIEGTDAILVIHAMTPPQQSILKELGVPRSIR